MSDHRQVASGRHWAVYRSRDRYDHIPQYAPGAQDDVVERDLTLTEAIERVAEMNADLAVANGQFGVGA